MLVVSDSDVEVVVGDDPDAIHISDNISDRVDKRAFLGKGGLVLMSAFNAHVSCLWSRLSLCVGLSRSCQICSLCRATLNVCVDVVG